MRQEFPLQSIRPRSGNSDRGERHRGEGDRVSSSNVFSSFACASCCLSFNTVHLYELDEVFYHPLDHQAWHTHASSRKLPCPVRCVDSRNDCDRRHRILTSDDNRSRNLAFFSVISLGGTYMILKSRTLAAKQEKKAGDYSVSVDRSGALPPVALL